MFFIERKPFFFDEWLSWLRQPRKFRVSWLLSGTVLANHAQDFVFDP
jgi:hypothetical protein